MPDSMDNVPTVHERLAAATAEIALLRGRLAAAPDGPAGALADIRTSLALADPPDRPIEQAVRDVEAGMACDPADRWAWVLDRAATTLQTIRIIVGRSAYDPDEPAAARSTADDGTPMAMAVSYISRIRHRLAGGELLGSDELRAVSSTLRGLYDEVHRSREQVTQAERANARESAELDALRELLGDHAVACGLVPGDMADDAQIVGDIVRVHAHQTAAAVAERDAYLGLLVRPVRGRWESPDPDMPGAFRAYRTEDAARRGARQAAGLADPRVDDRARFREEFGRALARLCGAEPPADLVGRWVDGVAPDSVWDDLARWADRTARDMYCSGVGLVEAAEAIARRAVEATDRRA